jgi:asparagine synthase (glutamine-hydrolysing)
MDEPIADPGFIAIYQVVKFSREFVKVILSGNGGDEFYAGYAPFKALTAQRWASRLMPAPLLTLAKQVAGGLPASHDYMNLPFVAQRFLRGVGVPPSQLLSHWVGSFDRDEIQTLMCPPPATDVYAGLDDGYPATGDPVSRLLHSFQMQFLTSSICNHADKASMMVSQELRSPFLDTELMRFANRLPVWMKVRRGETKVLLRRYLARAGLRGTAGRPKRGFTVPVASWLTTSLRSWANDLLEPSRLAADGFFEPKVVRRLWDEHQARRQNHAKALWTLLVFQHWLHVVYPAMKGDRS